MELLGQMFQEFATPEERQLVVLVKQQSKNAGIDNKIIDNKKVMKGLLDAEASISAPPGMERHKTDKKPDLVEIQHEIRENLTEAIEKNMESFNRKFDFQRRLIREDVEDAIGREGKKIISAINAGPYQRVLDPVRIFSDHDFFT